MPQPTLLNLDEFRVSRSVVIGGRERILKNMTVEQFLQAGDIERKLEEAGSERAQIPILIDLIAGHLEDTPREDILGLDLAQLMILLAFIRGIGPTEGSAPGQNRLEENRPGESRAGKRGSRRAR
ncbi:hypothetical protein [Azospirillum sp. B510]|uniref:hypothetical protein n=1 Tax=Azospirillum sp. (strain B510) TaxID=137722 RepID=UPI00030C602B|nr:hypothetical protein [Azospirillum sp. B510]